MKYTMIIAAFLLLAGITTADTGTVTTTVNLTTDANQVTISTEQWTTTYSCNITSGNNRTVTFQREVSGQELTDCRNSVSNLSLTMQNLANSFKDSKNYGVLYTECFANLSVCKNQNTQLQQEISSKADEETKLSSCQVTSTTCLSDKNQMQMQLQSCSSEKTSEETELQQTKQKVWTYSIIGIIASGALTYYFMNKKSVAGIGTQGVTEEARSPRR